MTFDYQLDEQSPETQRVQAYGGIVPATLEEEVALIRAHLARAIEQLESADTSALSLDQRARRRQMIEALRLYRDEGIFPLNPDFAGFRVPYFVDELGTRCAMGHLIDVSGHGELTEFVRDNDNHAKVQDLADNCALQNWLQEHGLTAEEAALVQPAYGGVRYPASDRVMDQLDNFYKQAAKEIDSTPVNQRGQQRYYVNVNEEVRTGLQGLLEEGSKEEVKDTYVKEGTRIASQKLTTLEGFPEAPNYAWPEPKPTSPHTTAAGQALIDQGGSVRATFEAALKAHGDAIARFQDGKTYITQAEVRAWEAVVTGYRAATEHFGKENVDWVKSVNLDGNKEIPQLWMG